MQTPVIETDSSKIAGAKSESSFGLIDRGLICMIYAPAFLLLFFISFKAASVSLKVVTGAVVG